MKTISAKAAEVTRDWFVVDASDKTLGRLASQIAHRLRGKHKAEYTPHVDTGDYIVVVNAEKIRVTGAKSKDKMYHHHTGYPGGLKSISFEKLIDKAPERAIQTAVKGMLPKNTLGRAMFRKLKVYAGTEHPHAAQQLTDNLYGSYSILWNWPSQDVHRPRIFAKRRWQYNRQQATAGPVFWSRGGSHDCASTPGAS